MPIFVVGLLCGFPQVANGDSSFQSGEAALISSWVSLSDGAGVGVGVALVEAAILSCCWAFACRWPVIVQAKIVNKNTTSATIIVLRIFRQLSMIFVLLVGWEKMGGYSLNSRPANYTQANNTAGAQLGQAENLTAAPAKLSPSRRSIPSLAA